MRGKAALPIFVRLLRSSEFDPVTKCWNWMKGLDKDGYAKMRMDRAARVSYETFIGAIPNNLQLDHLCRNRKCINPEHLEPVTARTNTLRGVGITAKNAAKIHCPRGHELSGTNLVPSALKIGARRCLICRRESGRIGDRIRLVRDAAKISARRKARYAARKLERGH